MRTFLMIFALAALTIAAPRHAVAQTPDPMLVAKGAQIYGNQCMRCHNLRSPSEFNDIDWRTIMAQMRARANLTREQTNAVLAFVQATNAPPATAAAVGAAVHAQAAAAEAASGKRALSATQVRQLRAYLTRLTIAPRR
ncbi:MAG TPA: hypothetical protein VJ957_01770 [Longimicrobiales bacterium]|nr:hypothetical protein [Longimicrobiales bacterium]